MSQRKRLRHCRFCRDKAEREPAEGRNIFGLIEEMSPRTLSLLQRFRDVFWLPLTGDASKTPLQVRLHQPAVPAASERKASLKCDW
jgi:hypothetical protein